MVNENLNIGLSYAFRNNPKITEYHEIPVNENCFERLSNLDFDPDIIFIQIQNEKIGKRNTLDLNPILQKQFSSSFIINWTGDKRATIPKWIPRFTHDLACFSNWDDVKSYDILGRSPSDFLQIGIDPQVFNRNHPVKTMMVTGDLGEIVFFGNHAGHFPLSNFRKNAVTALKKRYGNRFQVYGNGYREARSSLNADPRNPNHNQIKEAYIYSRAKIGISISHFNSNGYFSDRLLRGMASGCCMLSHDFKGSDKLSDKKAIIRFHDINMMLKVCDALLENEDERNLIRDTGYNYVHANHTYHNMTDDILNLYKKWK